MTKTDFFKDVRSVEKEFAAARLALSRLRSDVQTDPTVLHRTDVEQSHVRKAQDKLEGTYLVRMFSEFDMALRAYLKVGRGTATLSRMGAERLVNRVAGLENIPTDRVTDVHGVREYRNQLVHVGLISSQYTLGDCRSKLCRFLAFLPHRFVF